MRSLHIVALAAVLAVPAHADFIIGTVLTASGAPVQGANLDVFNSLTGAELALVNDNTAADGSFAVQVPAGTYDVVIHPPAPPATTLVGARRNSVVVAGIADLGVITVQQGVILSGQFLRPGGAPAANTALEMEDALTGELLVMTADTTMASGSFTTTAPFGLVELRADPGSFAPLAAPYSTELNLTGNQNLGSVQLAVGYFYSLTVLRPNGTGVPSADLDAIDTATGDKLYTPSDNTNAQGFADFVVPAGTYDIDVCAPISERLASSLITNVTVSGTTNGGSITLQAGNIVSGTVRDPQGTPLVNIDLDAFLPGTLTMVPTCNDNSDLNGFYQVVLPSGFFDLLFADTESSCGASVLIPNVNLTGDLTLNVTLASAGIGCAYCQPAVPNSTGVAGVIRATGSLVAAAGNVTLIAEQLPANQFGYFLNSQTQGLIVGPGSSQGNLCLTAGIGRYNGPGQILNSGSSGGFQLVLNLAQTPTPNGPMSVVAGQTWNFQCWYRDLNPSATSNFTNATELLFE